MLNILNQIKERTGIITSFIKRIFVRDPNRDANVEAWEAIQPFDRREYAKELTKGFKHIYVSQQVKNQTSGSYNYTYLFSDDFVTFYYDIPSFRVTLDGGKGHLHIGSDILKSKYSTKKEIYLRNSPMSKQHEAIANKLFEYCIKDPDSRPQSVIAIKTEEWTRLKSLNDESDWSKELKNLDFQRTK